MAAEWFCNIEGTELGPLSSDQLRGLVEKGRLMPDDQIRQGTDGAWIPATRVKGLFPASSRVVSEAEEVPVAKPVDSDAAKPGKDKPARRPPKSKKLKVAHATPEPPVAAVPQAKPAAAPPVPPVAAPVAKASAPTPAPATPVAKAPAPAAPAGAPAGNQFGIVTDAPSPAGTSASAPPPADPREKKKQKQQQNLVIVGALLVLLVILGVGGLVAVNMAGNTPDEPDTSTAEAEGEVEVEPDPTPAEPATVVPEKPPEVKWADASKGVPERRGDVEVKILSAGVGKAPWRRWPASVDRDSPMLLVSLEVKNLTEQKKIKYAGWSPGSRTGKMKLVDDIGNEYDPPKSGSTIEGQQSETSLYPDKPLSDLLVFEPPIERAKSLQLQLPAAAFGELGYLRFEIPASWIKEIPDEPAEEEPRPGPADGPSAIDRGIDDVRGDDPLAEPRQEEPKFEPEDDIRPETIDELFRDSPELRGDDMDDDDGMETLGDVPDPFNQPDEDRDSGDRLDRRRPGGR